MAVIAAAAAAAAAVIIAAATPLLRLWQDFFFNAIRTGCSFVAVAAVTFTISSLLPLLLLLLL